MIWVPIGLGLFKLTVIGTTIFFSIKTHREGEEADRKKREAEGVGAVPGQGLGAGAGVGDGSSDPA